MNIKKSSNQSDLLIVQPIAAAVFFLLSSINTYAQIISSNALVRAASNGVPVVNIVTADKYGNSINWLSSFNVGASGVIFNNSATAKTSVLVQGLIDGNPFMSVAGTVPAKLILGNVASANKSSINGMVEVVGNAADLVLINKRGIDCTSCGFLNTPKVTLVTGELGRLNGNISWYNVTGGDINVNGMNASKSIVNFLAASLAIDGDVKANKLKAVIGSNIVASGTLFYENTAEPFTSPNVFKGITIKPLANVQSGEIFLIETMGNFTRINSYNWREGINIAGNINAVGDVYFSTPGAITDCYYYDKLGCAKSNVKSGLDYGIFISSGGYVDLSRTKLISGELNFSANGVTGGVSDVSLYGGLNVKNIYANGISSLNIDGFYADSDPYISVLGDINYFDGGSLRIDGSHASVGGNINFAGAGDFSLTGGVVDLFRIGGSVNVQSNGLFLSGMLDVDNISVTAEKKINISDASVNARGSVSIITNGSIYEKIEEGGYFPDLIPSFDAIKIERSNIIAVGGVNLWANNFINVNNSNISSSGNISFKRTVPTDCATSWGNYCNYQDLDMFIKGGSIKAAGDISFESSTIGFNIESTLSSGRNLLINAPNGYSILKNSNITVGGAALMSGYQAHINNSSIIADSLAMDYSDFIQIYKSSIKTNNDLVISDAALTPFYTNNNPLDYQSTRGGMFYVYNDKPCEDMMICAGSLISNHDIILRSGLDLKLGATRLQEGIPAENTTITRRFAAQISAGNNIIFQSDRGIINVDGAYLDAKASILMSGKSVGIFGPSNIAISKTSTTQVRTETDVPASIHAIGDISILATGDAAGLTEAERKGDILINGANINSLNGHIAISAAHDIDISNDVTTNTYYSEYYRIKKRLFSTTREVSITSSTDQTLIPSVLEAQTISLAAGNDLTIAASDIQATGSIGLHADHNLDLLSSAEIDSNYSFYQLSKTGLFGSGSPFGFTVGKRVLTQTSTENTQTQLGASISSLLGDISLTAGNQMTQMSSELLAPVGSIRMAAKEVAIATNNNTYSLLNAMRITQTGYTLSFGHPLISSYNQLVSMEKAKERTQSGHTQALAVLTSALTLNSAYKTYKSPDDFSNTNVYDPAYAKAMGRWSLNVSLGSSTYSNESFTFSSLPVESSIVAGRDVSIEATGQAAQSQGDITISGAAIQAGGALSLKANDEITLLAAKSTQIDTTREKSTATSFGFSVSAQGLAATFAASRMRGFTNGRGTSYFPVELTAGLADSTGVLSLSSGTNTNIQGATLSGYQVAANVGGSGVGNLLMLSPQDTSFYEGAKKSWGIDLSIPVGSTGTASFGLNYSKMKLLADFQSAKEQTAIRAGNGGFNINVNGATRLDGAVLNSTAASNTLTTHTLVLNDLVNKENVTGSSTSLSLSYSSPTNGTGSFGGTTYGFADIDRATLGHTKAAIVAGATLNIMRPDLQTQSVVSMNRDVNAAHQPLAPSFDARQATADLETGAAVMAAFSRAGYEFAGTYAQEQVKKGEQLLNANKDPLLSAEVKAQNKAEADNLLKVWGSGGVGRAALHTLVGGAAWGSVGALASATNVLTEPYQNEAVDAAMRALGLDPATNETLRNSLKFAASTALGGALGGAQGAAATFNADANNRQLHPDETTYIKRKIADWKQKRPGGSAISDAQAEQELARGSLYGNDSVWREGFIRYTPDELAIYVNAAEFLKVEAARENFTFTNLEGKQQAGFTSTAIQFSNTKYLASVALSNPQTRQLYEQSAVIAFKKMSSGDQALFGWNGIKGLGIGVPLGMDERLKAYVGLVDQQTYIRMVAAAKSIAADPDNAISSLISSLKSDTKDAALGVYLSWMQKDSQALGQMAGEILGAAIVDTVLAATGVSVVKNSSQLINKGLQNIGDKIALHTGPKLDRVAKNALVNNTPSPVSVKRELSAADANLIKANEGYSGPWAQYTKVNEVDMPIGSTFSMYVNKEHADLLSRGNIPVDLGGFFTFDKNISTVADMRDTLAIAQRFKPDSDGPFFKIDFQVIKNMPAQVGTAGRMLDANSVIRPGGGTQGIFLDYNNRATYMKPIGLPTQMR